jgi:putative ABC transport system permease protein
VVGIRISPLNRKLLRDLLLMKGQAIAIAMVVAAGVAMNVMYLSTFESLRGTRYAYYDRQRFADVFATLKRAPQRVGDEIARLPGVSAVDTRVSAAVTLDLPNVNEPATAQLVSIAF